MKDSAAVEPNGDERTASAPSYMEEDDDELLNLLQEDGEKAVKFVNNPYPSSSYVTINGNKESRDSSFSGFETFLMASIDVRSFSSIPEYQVSPFSA
jgi:hypothetical protein